jgi:4-hydroxy-2-oxoheptanedioate aldolase
LENKLKEKLENGGVALGTFMFTYSPTVMEILGHSGFDFVIIDTEHAPTGISDTITLEHIIRAAEVSGTVPLVRLPERSKIMTQKALDAGAKGIVVPWVQTKEDAEEAVKDTKYPPMGHRGSCFLTRPTGYSSKFTPDYWESANENTMVIPLLENQTALDNIDEILSVPGLDFIFFGGRDYSMSCGFAQVNNPVTNAARELLIKKCDEYGVPMANFLYSPFDESVKNSIAKGARVLVAGGDVSLLLQICQELRQVVDNVS